MAHGLQQCRRRGITLSTFADKLASSGTASPLHSQTDEVMHVDVDGAVSLGSAGGPACMRCALVRVCYLKRTAQVQQWEDNKQALLESSLPRNETCTGPEAAPLDVLQLAGLCSLYPDGTW